MDHTQSDANDADGAKSVPPWYAMLAHDPGLVVAVLDQLPVPLQVFTPDGVLAFANRALLDLNGVTDPAAVVGKYNIRADPALKAMGANTVVERAFAGHQVLVEDFHPPIHELVERGVVADKPFESASMDAFLYPVSDGHQIAYVVSGFIVNRLHQGQPDVVRAREYIEHHWREPYDPEATAASVNLSVRQLYALFAKHADQTPGSYYKQVKIDHLKQALADPRLNVAEAFAGCGVDSRGTFARLFKQATGYSPRQFRARATDAT